jgi:hypothetical protein
MFNALVWSFDFDLRDISNDVSICSLVSDFYRMKTLFRWSRLVVSFCIPLFDWFFFLGSDWIIGRQKWQLLIGQISWLLIG